jgi:hypothetical protein
MAPRRFSALVSLAIISAPALAENLVTEVTSTVYQTSGTPREIAARASTCIAQNLRAGTTQAPLIVSSDLDGGVVVAQNELQFAAKANEWQIRSRFTFEARDSRFRITQTGLEMFSPIMREWRPFYDGGVGTRAKEAFAASADTVAQCVIAGKRADW